MTVLTDLSTAPTSPAAPTFLARAPFGDPGALGLAAFALTTFMLSLANSHLIAGAEAAVIGLALFYGGIAQILAGMWEFANNNVFGGTAFVSYGAFWLSFWWLLTHPEELKAAGAIGIGAYLLAWTIFTAFMTIASFATNGATVAVFVVLTVTFAALAVGEFTGIAAIGQLGGWLGLITAGLAWYASAASVINATWKRVVLPVFPTRIGN